MQKFEDTQVPVLTMLAHGIAGSAANIVHKAGLTGLVDARSERTAKELASSDVRTRRVAAHKLAFLASVVDSGSHSPRVKEAIDSIVSTIGTEPNERLRAEMLHSLGETKHPALLRVLAAHTDEKYPPLIRESAIHALGNRFTPESARVLTDVFLAEGAKESPSHGYFLAKTILEKWSQSASGLPSQILNRLEANYRFGNDHELHRSETLSILMAGKSTWCSAFVGDVIRNENARSVDRQNALNIALARRTPELFKAVKEVSNRVETTRSDVNLQAVVAWDRMLRGGIKPRSS